MRLLVLCWACVHDAISNYISVTVRVCKARVLSASNARKEWDFALDEFVSEGDCM